MSEELLEKRQQWLNRRKFFTGKQIIAFAEQWPECDDVPSFTIAGVALVNEEGKRTTHLFSLTLEEAECLIAALQSCIREIEEPFKNATI